MKNIITESTFPFLMTEAELKNLGLEEVGYVKPYKVKGQIAWVLHAEDGSAITVQNNPSAIRLSAQQQDINLVSLH